jgi:hypothetical protein
VAGNIMEPQRDDERYGVAKVVGRSRLFFTVPIIIMCVISANFIWEAIRINVGARAAAEWPLRVTVLGISTTATVLAVFVGLFMGRLQWAHTLRPHIGTAIDDESTEFRVDSNKWRFWLYNAGPGGAVISDIKYYVRFADQLQDRGIPDWVSLAVINDQFRSRNLIDGVDYFIRWNTGQSPLPVLKSYSEGKPMAWFTVKALAQLSILDIRAQYSDVLGDSYENVIPVMHRLPSVTVSAIAIERSKPLPPRK